MPKLIQKVSAISTKFLSQTLYNTDLTLINCAFTPVIFVKVSATIFSFELRLSFEDVNESLHRNHAVSTNSRTF